MRKKLFAGFLIVAVAVIVISWSVNAGAKDSSLSGRVIGGEKEGNLLDYCVQKIKEKGSPIPSPVLSEAPTETPTETPPTEKFSIPKGETKTIGLKGTVVTKVSITAKNEINDASLSVTKEAANTMLRIACCGIPPLHPEHGCIQINI